MLKGVNGLYFVETGGEIVECRAASRIRKEDDIKILAGERVNISLNDDSDRTGFIHSINKRENSFVRPPVANVRTLMIVSSSSHPAPDIFYIDLLTVIAEKNNCRVIIVFTKSDINEPDEYLEIYRRTPFLVFGTCIGDEAGKKEILCNAGEGITVLAGVSGAGKSTFLRELFPERTIETGDLSRRIMRGKNTTRVTELYKFDENSYIADSPGFGSITLSRYCYMEPEELITYFPDLREHVGSCRYGGCTHLGEDGCGIKSAVAEGAVSASRAASYESMYRELKENRVYPKKDKNSDLS